MSRDVECCQILWTLLSIAGALALNICNIVYCISAINNNSDCYNNLLVPSLSIGMWLLIIGSLNLAFFIIPPFIAYLIDDTSYGKYFKVISVIYTAFQLAWLVLGAIMFWAKDSGCMTSASLYLTTMRLMWASLIVGFAISILYLFMMFAIIHRDDIKSSHP